MSTRRRNNAPQMDVGRGSRRSRCCMTIRDMHIRALAMTLVNAKVAIACLIQQQLSEDTNLTARDLSPPNPLVSRRQLQENGDRRVGALDPSRHIRGFDGMNTLNSSHVHQGASIEITAFSTCASGESGINTVAGDRVHLPG